MKTNRRTFIGGLATLTALFAAPKLQALPEPEREPQPAFKPERAPKFQVLATDHSTSINLSTYSDPVTVIVKNKESIKLFAGQYLQVSTPLEHLRFDAEPFSIVDFRELS